jgi:hypothetical protein
MKRLSLLLLFLSSSLYSQSLYSLQLVTFKDFEKASKYQKNFANKIPDLFIYKTDRGYWTIRYKIESDRDRLLKIKRESNLKEIRNSLLVPTSIEKVGKIDKNREEEREKPKRDILKSKISEIKETYHKIDTFTFNLKVDERIYVIQFTKYPYSRMADIVFNERPSQTNLNSLTISNNLVTIPISYGELELSSIDIEKEIPHILNVSRKNRDVRVKVFRVRE